jgi:META domain
MLNQYRRCICFFAFLTAAVAASAAAAGDAFPFGSELMLDASPMGGSKRIPMLEIEDDGSASIDLWCTSLRAQATVTDDSITIVPGAPASLIPGQQATDPQAAPCDPDRQASDTALVSALSQVSKWRRRGDLIELSGPTTLRYRLMTN